MGQSPATGPTANRGYEAAAMQGMAVAVKALEQLLPLFGSGSDQGKDVMKAIQTLSKHIPPGAVTPAAERNQLEKMALQQTQDSQMMARMKQAQAAPQGQPPQGGMPQQRAA
jgi:hypothetical protein